MLSKINIYSDKWPDQSRDYLFCIILLSGLVTFSVITHFSASSELLVGRFGKTRIFDINYLENLNCVKFELNLQSNVKAQKKKLRPFS